MIGTADSAEKLWNEATEELPDITFKQLAALLSKLDKLADKVRYEFRYLPNACKSIVVLSKLKLCNIAKKMTHKCIVQQLN